MPVINGGQKIVRGLQFNKFGYLTLTTLIERLNGYSVYKFSFTPHGKLSVKFSLSLTG